jgi:lipid-binding SYLF domain-containing protein
MRFIMVTAAAMTLAMTPLVAADNEPAQRLDESAAVFSEIMAAPDKGIPLELFEKAHCIVIVPDLKTGAFVVGGSTGRATYPVAPRAELDGRRLVRSASRVEASASKSVARLRM